ncbi:RNA polymerase sigma factor [Caulobacter sp. S45]|uniref:RNA polymerase sigma factor n=1 Tax=Caulobacter sp. S45 TaxID=1641861 RepID=UPI0020C6115D|nr:sigma-70 family RNA polymerase sigma factor [Caulobacter sp. S45]
MTTSHIRTGLADAELAVLAQAGDRSAFGELVRRHGPAVRGLLRRMGAQPSLADDVAQDAFLAAYERIAEFRGQGAFAGWVKRIAARLYIKRCKRQLRLAELGAADADTAMQTPGESAAGQRLDLDGALKLLSPAERLCVSLCCGAGFSHAELAEALKSPLGTVKSHVRRGLDKMKAHLTSEVPEGHPSVSVVSARGGHV